MKKPVCEKLKRNGCLKEIKSCKWNKESKTCTSYKLSQFEDLAARSKNPASLVKIVCDQLQQLNIIEGVTLLIKTIYGTWISIPMSKIVIDWNNISCPKILFITGVPTLLKTLHELTKRILEISNRRLDEINEQDFTRMTKELNEKSSKITMSAQYFISDYIRHKVSNIDLRKSFALAHNENTSKSIIVYNGCEIHIDTLNHHFKGLMNDALTLQLNIVSCPYMFKKNLSLPANLGFARLDPIPVQYITHGKYKPNPDVREAYVNNAGSKELNISMSLMLQENEKLHVDIQKRIMRILEEFKKLTEDLSEDLFDETYVAYHGTTQEIHTTQTFVTTSFLSTTRSLTTAIEYGSFIYVITIPKRFPVINFNDTYKQILLPIGTYIEVEKIVQLETVKLITCHITEEPLKLDSFISIFQNPCTRDNIITLKKTPPAAAANVEIYNQLLTPMLDYKLSEVTMSTGSSTFYTTIVDGKSYIVKDIVKRRQVIRVLRSDNQVFKRVFNELLASHIYSRVYELATINMSIMDKRSGTLDQPILKETSNYLLFSEWLGSLRELQIMTQNEKNSVYEGMLVDCIMGNWDAFNEGNTAMFRDKPIRPDVGGALFFRGRGDPNVNFKKGSVPNDHMNFAKQASFKKLSIPIEKSDLAIKYLASISAAKVKSRLERVKKDFIVLLDMINEREFAKKYQDMLDHVIDAVKYRDAWYRKNGAAAIKSINYAFVKSAPPGLNGGAAKEIPFQPDKSPMSFTASPAEFKRMLERHQVCARK